MTGSPATSWGGPAASTRGSALTDTLPLHRLALDVGGSATAPAACDRVLDLRVERLEQTHARLPGADGERPARSAPVPGYCYELVYGDVRLVDDHPGIARQVAVAADVLDES